MPTASDYFGDPYYPQSDPYSSPYRSSGSSTMANTNAGAGIGGGIGGAVGGLVGLLTAPGGGSRYYKQAIDVWQKIQDPNFDVTQLSPPEMQIAGQIAPEVFEAQTPGAASQISEDPAVRAMQMQGQARSEQASRQGLLPEERALLNSNLEAGAREGRRADLNVLRNLAMRGAFTQGGSDEGALRMIANQNSQHNAAQMGLNAAQVNLQRRDQARQDAFSQAGQIRGQDFTAGQANANLQARFNELVAQQRQEAARYAADQRAQAQAYNVGTKQRVGEQNTLNAYQTAQQNIDRKNQAQQALFNARAQRAQGLSGALTGYGQQKDLTRAAYIGGATQIGSGLGQAAGGAAGYGLS